jgi:hypothetical protein
MEELRAKLEELRLQEPDPDGSAFEYRVWECEMESLDHEIEVENDRIRAEREERVEMAYDERFDRGMTDVPD